MKEANEYGTRQGHGYRFSLDDNRLYSGTSYHDEHARPYFKMVAATTLEAIDEELAQSRAKAQVLQITSLRGFARI